MSETARHRRGSAQRVIDAEHRCDFVQMPFLLLGDVAAGRLQPTAVVLWLYYKRRAWENRGGNLPPAETLRETEKGSGLSRGTIMSARSALADCGWVELHVEGCRREQLVTVTLLERWEENCRGHAPVLVQNLDRDNGFGRNPDMPVQNPDMPVQNLDKPHLNDDPIKTLEDLKDPQRADGVGDVETRVSGFEPQLPGMLTEDPPAACDDPGGTSYTPAELLVGLYQDGLGSKPAREMRELESARDLLADGATPADAATWAREAVADGHIKIITAATFLKAWPGWRARRRRTVRAIPSSGYEHDPWQNRRPPIAEADLSRGAAV